MSICMDCKHEECKCYGPDQLEYQRGFKDCLKLMMEGGYRERLKEAFDAARARQQVCTNEGMAFFENRERWDSFEEWLETKKEWYEPNEV